MTHDEAANAANVRLVIDSYDKQIKSLTHRLQASERELRTLRQLVSVFENYHEQKESA